MRNFILGIATLISFSVLAAFSRNAQPDLATAPNQAFQEFLNQFPLVHLPYALPVADLQQSLSKILFPQQEVPDTSGLSWDGSNTPGPSRPVPFLDPHNFILEKKSRWLLRSAPVLLPNARMETAKHIAVVYSSVHRFGYQLPTYFVAVFDKEGLLISKNQIASLSLHEIQAVTIHRHLNATLQTYWLNWEKNIDTTGWQP